MMQTIIFQKPHGTNETDISHMPEESQIAPSTDLRESPEETLQPVTNSTLTTSEEPVILETKQLKEFTANSSESTDISPKVPEVPPESETSPSTPTNQPKDLAFKKKSIIGRQFAKLRRASRSYRSDSQSYLYKSGKREPIQTQSSVTSNASTVYDGNYC